jgi:hypothetical protein
MSKATQGKQRVGMFGNPDRLNHFVLQKEAVARDDQCVKALEEVLAQRERVLIQAQPIAKPSSE